jgi:hypothetical protein
LRNPCFFKPKLCVSHHHPPCLPNQDQRADDEDAWDDSSSSSDSSSDGEERNGDAAEPATGDTEERPPVEPTVDSGNGSGDPVMPSSSDPPADLVMETPTETKPESSVLSKSSNPICS